MKTYKGLMLALLVSIAVQIQADAPPAPTENSTPVKVVDDSKKLKKGTPEGQDPVGKNADASELEKKQAYIPLAKLVPEGEDKLDSSGAYDASSRRVARMLVDRILQTKETPKEALTFLVSDSLAASDKEKIREQALTILGQYYDKIWEASKDNQEKEFIRNRTSIVVCQLSNQNCFGGCLEAWSKIVNDNRMFTGTAVGVGVLASFVVSTAYSLIKKKIRPN